MVVGPYAGGVYWKMKGQNDSGSGVDYLLGLGVEI